MGYTHMNALRTLLFGLALAWTAAALAEDVERNFETTDDPSISINNYKGSITIVGWDELAVRITGTVSNSSTILNVDEDEDDPDIRVESSKRGSRPGEARLTFYVPRASSLDIETVSAPIDITGVSGNSLELQTVSGNIDVEGGWSEVEIEGVSGSIKLLDATGEVDVSNVSGKVAVQGNLESLEIELVSGGIDVDVSAESVSAASVSGSIDLGVIGAEEVSGESVSGSMKFTGSLAKNGEMELHALSGGITVEFTEPACGEYELSSFSGSINCHLEPLSTVQRNRKSMEFDFGEGECSVELESFSGSITVR